MMKRSSAFTLIELLLAIAIIGVLAVLITSVSSLTRLRAEAATCLGNLRQTNQALLQYIADHNGNLLPATTWSTHASRNSIGSFYVGIRDYLGIETDAFNVNDAKVRAAFLRDTTLTCPSLRRINPNEAVLNRCFSINGFLYQKDPASKYQGLPYQEIPPLKNAPQKIANVAHPSEMWTFSDGAHLKNSNVYAGSYDSVAYASLLYYPHSERNHFVFLDGHVEALTRKEFEEKTQSNRFWGKVVP